MRTAKHSVGILLILCLLLSLCACVGTPEEPAVTDLPAFMRILPNTEKLERSAPLPETGLTALEAFMAINEAEGMQFAVRFDKDVTNAHVMLSALTSEKGDVLEDVVLYKEHYTELTEEVGGKPAGFYPDALIEAFDGSDGRMRTDLTDVKAGENQAWWITVTTPIGQKPGVYTGTATFSYDQGDDVVIPVKVTVWNVELPEKTVYKTCFGLWNVPDVYKDVYTAGEYDELYWEFFLKYRISCGGLPADAVGASFNSLGTLTPEQAGEIADKYVAYLESHPRVSAFHLPVYGKASPGSFEEGMIANDVRNIEMYKALRDRDLLDLAHVSPGDEPENNALADLYFSMVGDDIMNAFPGLRIIIATTDHRSVFDDHWNGVCPGLVHVSEDLVDYFKERDIEPWWYTCLSPKPPHTTYFLCDTLMAPRIMKWMAKDFGVVGEIYWSATLSRTLNEAKSAYNVPIDTWTNPYVTPGAPGDGFLVYHGAEGDGHVDRNMIVPSLRLEGIRDGIEDYILLDMLEQKYASLIGSYGITDFTLSDLMDGLYFDALYNAKSDYTTDNALFAMIRALVASDYMNEDGTLTALLPSPAYGDLNGWEVRVYAPEGTQVSVDGETASYANGYYSVRVSGDKAGKTVDVSVNGRTVRRYLDLLSGTEQKERLNVGLEAIAEAVGVPVSKVQDSYYGRYLGSYDRTVSDKCLGSVLGDFAPILVTTGEAMNAGDAKTSTDVTVYAPLGAAVTCSLGEQTAQKDEADFATWTFHIGPQETKDFEVVFTVTADGKTYERREFIHQDQGEITWLVSEPTEITLVGMNSPIDFEVDPAALAGKTKIAVTMEYIGSNSYASGARVVMEYMNENDEPVDKDLGKTCTIYQPGKTVTGVITLPEETMTPVMIRLTSTSGSANDTFRLDSICFY